ncbi:MAG: hypothetical protein M5U31_13830 [Acidimicrobiia bacterium]|nr:hypothetical protein [Acidimicrobiia bacterium]
MPTDGAPTESSPTPIPRRLRRALLIGIGALVVLIAAAGLYIVFGHREPGEKSQADALEEFRSGTAEAQQGPTDRPAAGVYSATAEGVEDIGFGPLNEEFGPEAPVTVTHGAEGCFTVRVDLNTNHWRRWDFCVTDDALVEEGEVTSIQREFPGIKFDIVTTFTCDPPFGLLGRDGEVVEGTGSCTGENDSLEGTTSVEATVSGGGETTLDVAGEQRDAVVVQRDSVLSGFQGGTETVELTIDAETWMPLRISFDTDVDTESPLGRRPYRDTGSFTLTTLEPAT